MSSPEMVASFPQWKHWALIKWLASEVASFWKGKLMKWKFDEEGYVDEKRQVDEKWIIASGVAGLWKNKLLKCQVDEMSSWWNVRLLKCHVDEKGLAG
jgi:hypothetical protein